MTRQMILAVAQQGPISRALATANRLVSRLRALAKMAEQRGVRTSSVFPELALTTFFPRWISPDEAELDSFYPKCPARWSVPLFRRPPNSGIGLQSGLRELREGGRRRRFNTSLQHVKSGGVRQKRRKVSHPGHKEPEAYRPHQHLEKRYFFPGDLGFRGLPAVPASMAMFICNDRRWPELRRVMGLGDVELQRSGYNTPAGDPPVGRRDHLRLQHADLSMQAGPYQNSRWTSDAAKMGMEEGCDRRGPECIVAPRGVKGARSDSLEKLRIPSSSDLDCKKYWRSTRFNFKAHREPDHYRLIAEL
uniref:HyuC2 n=1 Tax=Agrobacterium tumefaciens TaxID=358 RepID=A7L7Y4_AGRTU|nr:HyuC2 [Agrobacterium tumefaciens]